MGGSVKNASSLLNTPMQSSFKPQDKTDIRNDAGGKCEYCGQDTTRAQNSQKGVTPPGNEGQTDHYDPQAHGGSSARGNGVHACRDCNREKSNTPPHGTKWQLPRMKKPDGSD